MDEEIKDRDAYRPALLAQRRAKLVTRVPHDTERILRYTHPYYNRNAFYLQQKIVCKTERMKYRKENGQCVN